MHALLPFIVLGLTAGSVYGLAATGLVLTYKTAGIFNFAHGAVATTAAYVFYILHIECGMPAYPAAALSVLVLGPVLGLLLSGMAGRLAEAPASMKIVATIGLVLFVQGFFTAIFGTNARTFPGFLPSGGVELGGVRVGDDQMITAGIALAVALGLFVFFRLSRTGLAMRAVVDNPELLSLGGTNTTWVRRGSWIIGATFAALAGVLLVPSLNLDATVLTLLVVQAFGAVAIGYFGSLPLTYVGGLFIGVAAAVVTKYVNSGTALGGLPASVPFIVLFCVLVALPRARLTDRRVSRVRVFTGHRAPPRAQLTGGVVVLAFLLLVPTLFGDYALPYWTEGLTDVVLFCSLGLLVRTAGQVSLCQVGFAAIGAAAVGHLTTGAHLPWLLALLLGGLIAVPVGALIAIPAIRLSGVFLALATFGFGLVLEQMGYPLKVMFGTSSDGLLVNRPSFAQSDQAYYYAVLAITVLVGIGTALLVHGRLGRLLRGMAESPMALNTSGTSVFATRVLVFCISAFLAAISGGLLSTMSFSVSGASFTSFSSLTYVALLVLMPGGEPFYALAAGFCLAVLPSYISTSGSVPYWLNVIFGLSAVQIAIGYRPQNRRLHALLDRLGRRRGSPPERPGTSAGPTARRAAPGEGLRVEDLTVRFGGSLAVDDVTLVAPPGRVTGLIGPNGAGKTTTFNAACGMLRPTAGRVHLNGTDISRLTPAARARLGLGRTFQQAELYDSLTVKENVALGAEAALAGTRPWRHVAGRPGERRRQTALAAEAMALTGVSELAGLPAGDLSTGQRRLVELARCLAGRYDILLLDEPSSGLDRTETARFGEILTEVVAERGVGILLVEHDMSLVMDICQHIYVLDFGTMIDHGPAAAVAASPAVRSAYLGAEFEARDIARSPDA